jgi:type IV fimbrial biogenesis protein FimT
MQRNGFTLIELLVTIAVMAILLAAATPSFRTMMINARLTSQANELLSVFHIARSEASKRARAVSICPTADGTACSANWGDGWMVYLDSEAVGSDDTDVDEVLRIWPAPGSDLKIKGGNVSAPGKTAGDLPEFVRVLPSGAVDPASMVGVTTYELRNPGCSGTGARNVVLTTIGRVSASKVSCS